MGVFKTLVWGALGGVTFGMSHAYVTDQMIKENNKRVSDRQKACLGGLPKE